MRFHHPRWWRRRRHHRRRARVILLVGGTFAVELIANEVVHMATELKVGQTLPLSIAYFDQNGAPMDVTPTPDAAPSWANLTPATAILTAAGDGLSANSVAAGAGTDTVRVTLTVGGTQFAATLDLTVVAAPTSQTLTSIGIVAGTPS